MESVSCSDKTSSTIDRQSAKDYMAFIELDELVPGVEGYLEK